MKNKICFIIQDGASIKSYLYSDIIKNLILSNYEVCLFHSISNKAIEEVENLHSVKINSYKIPFFKESNISLVVRGIITFSRLKRNKRITKNNTIITNWNPNDNGFLRFLLYRIIEFFGFIFSYNYSIILTLEKLLKNQFLKNDNDFRKVIDEINPNIIFNTNQRLVNAACIIEVAKEKNILTIGSIFSWDNLPKGNLLVKSDKYFVWSQNMKNELLQYYPEVEKNKIFITGTPQFEYYLKKHLYETKEVFYKRYNLDLQKKIICFSGDDKKTSPFDAVYLDNIATELMKLEENVRPQILFRPCPVDLSDRYDAVLKKHSNIIKLCKPIWNIPKDKKEKWSFVYPLYDDVKLLVNVALHCDAVVNIGSTMALDFSVLNKPAIYLNYNTNLSKEWTTEMIYNFQHFKSMPHKDVVFWIDKKQDISKVILKTMEYNNNKKEWLNFVTTNVENSTSNIVENIIKI